MNPATIILAASEAIKLTGLLMAEAKRTLSAADYAVLKAEQDRALAGEAATEAAWVPAEPPPAA